MARPNKQGLDYFPLDVDFLENEKMLAISGEFAVKGEIIVLRLLCEIYRNGYFVEYSGLLKNKLARLGGLSGGLVDEVVKRLVEYNFFNEEVFREHNVLTSKGVQKRYVEATKRRKNVDKSHYWLLNVVNAYINPTTSKANETLTPQSKVKESKVKNVYQPRSENEMKEWISYYAKIISLRKQKIETWCMKFRFRENEKGEISELRKALFDFLNERNEVPPDDYPDGSFNNDSHFLNAFNSYLNRNYGGKKG